VQNSKRATIKDIARVAGVSTASVSQALRPSSTSNIKLQQGTIDRVKSVALQLNYRPHSGARSIRSKHFGTLGYFVAKEGLFIHTPAGYMAGVHDAAEEIAYWITLIRLPHRLDEIRNTVPSVFSEHNLDALVIESYSEISEQIHDRLFDMRLPVIFLNDKHDVNSVYVDDQYGSGLLTQHMIDKGYRDICFLLRQNINGSPKVEDMHHSAVNRMTGFTETMEKNNLKAVVKMVKTPVVSRDVDLTDEQWGQIKEHGAIIAYDDDLANMIGRYCYRHRIRIPDDIAIAGFNGDYGSLCSWQKLTTVKIPSYEMGRHATEMALDLVRNGNHKPIPSAVYRPTLIPGDTA
jgi:LacI family transcriptional regulator